MSYISKANYLSCNDKFWQVIPTPSGMYMDIFKRITGQVIAMVSHHCKVTVIRFDLRPKGEPQTNKYVSQFSEYIVKKLKAKYKLTRVGYAWAREKGKYRIHYHCALIVDGNRINYPEKVLDIAKALWHKQPGNDFIYVDNCYDYIERGDYQVLANTIYRLSYLAKVYSKNHKAKKTHRFGASTIKMNTRPKLPFKPF